MLQNNSVLNLQYDSDLRVAQNTLYSDSMTITSSPSVGLPRTALPMPSIQTVGGSSFGRTFLPRSGLDLLNEMPSAHIEQTFELNGSLTSVSSENRFIIRSPLGDAIFSATESSHARDRTIWGSSRPFQLHLLDKNHQEALNFIKKFALGVAFCTPRSMEIWAPPGNVLGRVVEEFSLIKSDFRIEAESGELLYRIQGPQRVCGCLPKEAHFKIFTSDLHTMKGSITRIWSTEVSQFTLNVYFADQTLDLDVKSKALFLGAAFLFEYLYFQ